MSIGTITPILSAADIEALPNDKLKLQARAALAAGYTVDVRHIRYEYMIFANGVHFHPLTNWGQCVRLIVDTGAFFTIYGSGGIRVEGESAQGGYAQEYRTPTTDAEYRNQMCDAVVCNVAKGCAL